MKRYLACVIAIMFLSFAGFGTSFFATTRITDDQDLFGASGVFILPENCYPNLSLYLETYIIDQASLVEIGLGFGTETEGGFMFAGGICLLNTFPVATVIYDFCCNENLNLFGKVSLGPLAYPCYYPCSVWNVEVVASLNIDAVLVNLWFKDVSLPDLAYGRMDVNIGCRNFPLLLGIDTERLNSIRTVYTYIGASFEFENITLVPKLYFVPCGNIGVGFNLYGQF